MTKTLAVHFLESAGLVQLGNQTMWRCVMVSLVLKYTSLVSAQQPYVYVAGPDARILNALADNYLQKVLSLKSLKFKKFINSLL